MNDFIEKVPCIIGDTFGRVNSGDPGDLILTPGEPDDLR